MVCLGVGSTLRNWVGRGISEVASGLRAPKRYRRLEMATSWSWCDVAGASLMAQERNLRAWVIRYSGVSVVWMR